MTTTGTLYIIATPIGNLADWSYRAKEVVSTLDLLACEDTRRAKTLLAHYGLSVETTSFHEHNEKEKLHYIIDKLKSGQNVGVVSDAGTPLINDPGYKLVVAAKDKGIPVSPIPGSCAAIAAISASGIPTDRFSFEGFLPSKRGEKLKKLQGLQEDTRTLIFYEAPSRISTTIDAMHEAFGGDRKVCLAREITKLHETIVTLNLDEMRTYIDDNAYSEKGEIVLVVAGAEASDPAKDKLTTNDKKLISILVEKYSVSDAVSVSRQVLSASRKEIYAYAVEASEGLSN